MVLQVTLIISLISSLCICVINNNNNNNNNSLNHTGVNQGLA